MTKIGDMVSICRSKNAGPYILTVDLLFDDEENYYKVKNSKIINKETIARLYKIDAKHVLIYYWDAVKAIKITMPRLHSCGSRYDTDVFGAQQHMPIMDLGFNC